MRIRRNAHCRICVLKALKSDYLSVCRKTMSSLSDTRRARIKEPQVCPALFARALSWALFFSRVLRLRRRRISMNRKALKRTAALVALPLLLVVCSVAFAACAEKSDGTFPDGASMTLILATEPESVLSVDLSGMDEDVCLLDVLDSENIGYEMSGTLVNAVDGITLGSGEYIYFYTSVAADYDVSAWATTVEVNGVTLTNSGVGAADMTIENGCTIYIGTITYA